MSSIAYVTDENMLEYHRQCRNTSILFWRVSSKKKFTDFKNGDLLFFFARTLHSRKKGLVGYAHFDSVKRLSLSQMWKTYGQTTGYDNEELLKNAIERAAKGEIPKQMSCLYLTDVVFFVSPIYPNEIGVDIPINLESYCYLDRNNPEVTVEILKKAGQRGIDEWTMDQSVDAKEIFLRDEIRQQIAAVHNVIGIESGSDKERKQSIRLANEKVANGNGWELIRGSKTDCVKIDTNSIVLGLPFTTQANDKDARVREFVGRLAMYQMMLEKANLGRRLTFQVLGSNPPQDIQAYVEHFNNESL